jgi:hypothetical protein
MTYAGPSALAPPPAAGPSLAFPTATISSHCASSRTTRAAEGGSRETRLSWVSSSGAPLSASIHARRSRG